MSQLKPQSARDVYISINGIKVAAVLEYKVQIFTENKHIESIFQSFPSAIIPGKTSYTIEISRFLLTASETSSPLANDNSPPNLDQNTPALDDTKALEGKEVFFKDIDFYSLQNFDFVISKPDQKIVYSGCEWQNLRESTSAGKVIIENALISAKARTVIKE